MPTLVTDPPPNSVSLTVTQPTAKSRSTSGRPQSRSSGVFLLEAQFSYKGLDFDQRDELMAFLTDLSGRMLEFDVIVPTHSENRGMVSATAQTAALYAKNSTIITLTGITGELKKFNLIRANGEKATYLVTSAQTPVGGSQTITIRPPLREQLAANTSMLTKDVSINMALDDDSITCNTKGMMADIKFKMVEDPY